MKEVLGLWALVFDRTRVVEWLRNRAVIFKDPRPKTKGQAQTRQERT